MPISLKRLVATALCLWGFAFAGMSALHAAVVPDDVAQKLESLTDQFLVADGYEPIADVDGLTDAEWYTESRFPKWNTQSVFLPDTDMSPVQKAIMLVDHYEGTLPHVRYHVAFRPEFVFTDNYTAPPHAHITVTRFNLGPVHRQDLVEQVGEEHLAPEAEFGIGPSVSWRFVITPIQGQNAHVVAASRKVLSTAQTADMQCFDISCMSLALPEGPGAEMEEIDAPEHDAQAHEAGATPDYNSEVGNIADMLAQMALGDSGYGEPVEGLSPGESPLTLVLSSGVGGQDPAAAGMLHETHIMDDAIAELWYGRLQWEGAVYWMRHIVYRPGRS